jgi:hypothetical protein
MNARFLTFLSNKNKKTWQVCVNNKLLEKNTCNELTTEVVLFIGKKCTKNCSKLKT